MSDEQITKHGLSRALSKRDTIALGFGAIIGWSWIALISETMVRAGSMGAIIATLAAGLVIIAVGLIYSELASAMPVVGGEHAYSLRALGPHASFVCTWAIAFAYVTVVGFEAVALPDVLTNLFPDLGVGHLWRVNGADVYLDQAMIGAGTSVLVAWLNIRGIRIAAMVQLVVVIVIILSGLVLFTGAGLSGDTDNAAPLFLGSVGVLSAMALVPFMMVGFDVIPQTAEEINLPPRQIGQLLTASLALAVLWYLLIEISVAVMLPAADRPSGSLATIIASQAAFGVKGGTLLMIGGVAGILTSWNAFLIGGSRAIFALAQHGMLPAVFARVHPRYHTPVAAIIVISCVGVAAPFLGRQALIWFVDAGGLGLMVAYFFVACSYLMLRRREPEMERPYKAPGGLLLGWFGIGASVLMAGLYLPGMPAALVWPQEWGLFAAWFLIGGLLYVRSPSFVGIRVGET